MATNKELEEELSVGGPTIVSGDDPDTDESDDEEATGDEETDDEWKPPTKSEWNKIQRQLKRANTEARKAKAAVKAVPDEEDLDAKLAAAREEEAAKYKARIVKTEAKAKLISAGAVGDVAKLIRLIDLDEIDLVDDDEVEGLDDQIDDLKLDYPQLFDTKSKKSDPRTKGDASDKTAPKTPETAIDKVARMLKTGQGS